MAAGLPRQDHVWITTEELIRFQVNQFDEMFCKLDSKFLDWTQPRSKHTPKMQQFVTPLQAALYILIHPPFPPNLLLPIFPLPFITLPPFLFFLLLSTPSFSAYVNRDPVRSSSHGPALCVCVYVHFCAFPTSFSNPRTPDIWGDWQMRTRCLSSSLFLAPLAEVNL